MKLIFKIILIVGFAWTKTINPINNYEIEILEIKGKEREYVVLRSDEIVYEIEGPKLVVLHFRKPFPIKTNLISSMSLKVKLDDTKYIDQTENHFKSKDTISKKHPAHAYLNPGVLHINIPKGNHRLFINTEEDLLLIRLTTKKKLKRTKSDIYVEDFNNNPQVNVKTGKRSIPYSKISSQNSAVFYYLETGILWVYVRAIHNSDNSELIPLILSSSSTFPNPFSHRFMGSDFQVKNVFYSEISKQSEIEGLSTNIGKLRTYSIPISPIVGGVTIKNLSAYDVLIHGEFIPNK